MNHDKELEADKGEVQNVAPPAPAGETLSNSITLQDAKEINESIQKANKEAGDMYEERGLGRTLAPSLSVKDILLSDCHPSTREQYFKEYLQPKYHALQALLTKARIEELEAVADKAELLEGHPGRFIDRREVYSRLSTLKGEDNEA